MSCYRLEPFGFTGVPTSFWTPSTNLGSDLARLVRERLTAARLLLFLRAPPTTFPEETAGRGDTFDESDCGNGSGRRSGWDDVGGATGAVGSDQRCHR